MRIIAGKFKGLNIKTINDPSTRPMMSRAREGIFNSLQNDFNNSLVLDLFAGSGSLGIEALSRGASFVTFVDSSVDCKKIIDKKLNVRQTELLIKSIKNNSQKTLKNSANYSSYEKKLTKYLKLLINLIIQKLPLIKKKN